MSTRITIETSGREIRIVLQRIDGFPQIILPLSKEEAVQLVEALKTEIDEFDVEQLQQQVEELFRKAGALRGWATSDECDEVEAECVGAVLEGEQH